MHLISSTFSLQPPPPIPKSKVEKCSLILQLFYGLNALVCTEPLFKKVVIYTYHTPESKHFDLKTFLSMSNQLSSN
jgi:hypothetical protein